MIGDLLLDAGLISHGDLARAESYRKRAGGRMGPILVRLGAISQADLDQFWCARVVTPPLEEALDRLTGNRYSSHEDRQAIFSWVQRHETVVESMLGGLELVEVRSSLRGSASLVIGPYRSLEVEFGIDEVSGLCVIAEAGEAVVRRWMAMVDRQWFGGSARPGPRPEGVPEGFEAALRGLMGDSSSDR